MTEKMNLEFEDSKFISSVNYVEGINMCSTFESHLTIMQLTVLFNLKELDFLRRDSKQYDGKIQIKKNITPEKHDYLIDVLEHFEADISYTSATVYYFNKYKTEIEAILQKEELDYEIIPIILD